MNTENKKENKKFFLISILLRTGLAISFFYAAISSLLNPAIWSGFVPDFLKFIISPKIFLSIHSAYELILGFLLMSDYKTFYLSILSAVTLFIIIIFNLNFLDIVFRDIGLLLMAIALMVLSYKTNSKNR